MEFYQFFLALDRTDFFKNISRQSQESIHSYTANKPLLTPKGRAYLESWRSRKELFTKVTDKIKKDIILEEFSMKSDPEFTFPYLSIPMLIGRTLIKN